MPGRTARRQAAGRLRVAVLFGGPSGEHEVSLQSALAVWRALDRRRYEPVAVGITRAGEWRLPLDAEAALRRGPDGVAARRLIPFHAGAAGLLPADGGAAIPVDVVFPVLHGRGGEDGTLQGLLELAGVRYVGCGPLASALAMDKEHTKVVLAAHGLPVVPYRAYTRQEWCRHPDAIVSEVERAFGYPCFVKPVAQGSSLGTSKARDAAALRRAVSEAAAFGDRILVEQAIDGREIEISVLGNEEPIVSVPGEIVPGREFYDYAAKYLETGTQLHVPAELPSGVREHIQRLALQAYLALGCRGMARVDFFLARAGSAVWINELNTIPGFTAISMYPKLWEHTGIPLPALVSRLIDLALAGH